MHHKVENYIVYKHLRLIEQIVCILYCLYTGLFWLVARYHPAAIVGWLVDGLVCLALWYQIPYLQKVYCKELGQVAGDKELPDLVVSCEPESNLSCDLSSIKV